VHVAPEVVHEAEEVLRTLAKENLEGFDEGTGYGGDGEAHATVGMSRGVAGMLLLAFLLVVRPLMGLLRKHLQTARARAAFEAKYPMDFDPYKVHVLWPPEIGMFEEFKANTGTDTPERKRAVGASLMRRAVADVHILWFFERERPAINAMSAKGLLPDGVVQSFQKQWDYMNKELQEVTEEAEALMGGWGSKIISEAAHAARDQRSRLIREFLGAEIEELRNMPPEVSVVADFAAQQASQQAAQQNAARAAEQAKLAAETISTIEKKAEAAAKAAAAAVGPPAPPASAERQGEATAASRVEAAGGGVQDGEGVGKDRDKEGTKEGSGTGLSLAAVAKAKSLANAQALGAACAVCGTPSTNRCGNCKVVGYCCRDHQKAHWSAHKKLCQKGADAVRAELTRLRKEKEKEEKRLVQTQLAAPPPGMEGGAGPGQAPQVAGLPPGVPPQHLQQLQVKVTPMRQGRAIHVDSMCGRDIALKISAGVERLLEGIPTVGGCSFWEGDSSVDNIEGLQSQMGIEAFNTFNILRHRAVTFACNALKKKFVCSGTRFSRVLGGDQVPQQDTDPGFNYSNFQITEKMDPRCAITLQLWLSSGNGQDFVGGNHEFLDDDFGGPIMNDAHLNRILVQRYHPDATSKTGAHVDDGAGLNMEVTVDTSDEDDMRKKNGMELRLPANKVKGVVPKAGQMLIFPTNQMNIWRTAKVTKGRRIVLTVWLSTVEAHHMRIPVPVFEQPNARGMGSSSSHEE